MDVIREILLFLDVDEIIKLKVINKKWYNAIMNDSFWQKLIKRDFTINKKENNLNNYIKMYFLLRLKKIFKLHEQPDNLDKIDSIYVKDFLFTELPKEIKIFKNLDYLVIVNSNLKNIDIIGYFSNLTTLCFIDSDIHYLPKTIKFLSQLKTISIIGHNIKNLPNNICFLTNLELVNFNNGLLKNIPTTINKLTNLRSLQMSENKINKIGYINKLIKLKTLDLSINNIYRLPDLNLLVNLIELNLSYNKIKKISLLDNLHRLEILNLSNNKIKYFPNIFTLKLKKIFLHCNLITTIPSDIKKLTTLQTLYLSFNNIEAIPKLEKLTNLYELAIQYTNIHSIPLITKLTKLEVLSADHKFIANLPTTFIQNSNLYIYRSFT